MTGNVALNAKRTLKRNDIKYNMADLDSSLNFQYKTSYFSMFHKTAMKNIWECPISPWNMVNVTSGKQRLHKNSSAKVSYFINKIKS